MNASESAGPRLDAPDANRVVTPGIALGFVAIVAVFIVALAVSLTNLRTVYANSNAVAHTAAVKAELERVLKTLLDAETGQRGFIITGETAYLEPYAGALPAIAPQIDRVRQLTADNQAQQRDVERISAAVAAKMDELAASIEARRSAGLAAAQTVVATNLGKRTMDGIRAVVADMEAREDVLLAARTANAERSYATARLTAMATAGVGLFVAAALFFATRRAGVERRHALALAGQLRVTLTSIGDGVITTDNVGRVTHVNRVAEMLTGWTETDAIGRPLEDIFVIVNEGSRQPVENPIGQVLRDHAIVGLANHTVLISKQGVEVPVDDSAAPIKGDDGRLTGAVLVFRDVTERRRVERERTSLIADLETAVRSRDDFLAIASHELRNPVNAVQLQLVGALRAAQREGDAISGERLRDRVADAHAQVGRLVRLLDNLLDVSRISAGSILLEPEHVDLPDVVRGVVDQFRGELMPGQVTIDARAPVAGDWDRLRVEQALANLLSNAIKYGNGKPIDIVVDSDGRSARVSVTDHGIGIPPEQHARLFARFERGVSGRQYGGFGLGLWITREIIEAMQGQISVVSRPGEGSTFSIRLPLTTSETANTGTPS